MEQSTSKPFSASKQAESHNWMFSFSALRVELVFLQPKEAVLKVDIVPQSFVSFFKYM